MWVHGLFYAEFVCDLELGICDCRSQSGALRIEQILLSSLSELLEGRLPLIHDFLNRLSLDQCLTNGTVSHQTVEEGAVELQLLGVEFLHLRQEVEQDAKGIQ